MAVSENSITIDQTVETAPDPKKGSAVPKKFMNSDGSMNTAALLKSYAELEKKMSGKTEESPVTPAAKKAEVPLKEGLKLEAAKAADVKAVLGDQLFTDITKEYGESGTISAAAYDKLAEKGYSKGFVDAFIEGQKSLQGKYEAAVTAVAGGAEEYNVMRDWAKTGLSEAEQNEYNNNVESGDVLKAQMAVTYLQAKYRAAEGAAPRLVQGDASATTVEGFASPEEFAQAINDPRWQKDAAFTRGIMRRLEASTY